MIWNPPRNISCLCLLVWVVCSYLWFQNQYIPNIPNPKPITSSLPNDTQATTQVQRTLWRPTNDFESWDVRYDDRISAQLQWTATAQPTGTKRIVLADWDHYYNWFGKMSTHEPMLVDACPKMARACQFVPVSSTSTLDELKGIDAAVLCLDSTIRTFPRGNFTRFVMKAESSYYDSGILEGTDLLISYWTGSDIVMPYFRWTYYDPKVTSKKQVQNYASGKTKLAAIFVTNCHPFNDRLRYVKELQNLGLPVDVYGGCGPLKCLGNITCFNKLKNDYKFYLAFENANCRDYITEKLARNALENDIVPVVMGASFSDYVSQAPVNSFIHIDSFPSTKSLVDYLHFLDKNDTEYNKYFEWKGTGQITNGFPATKPFCRVCAMLHYADTVESMPVRTKPFDWSMTGQTKKEVNRRPCLPLSHHHWPNKVN